MPMATVPARRTGPTAVPAMESTCTVSPVMRTAPFRFCRKVPVDASLNCASLSVSAPRRSGRFKVPVAAMFIRAMPAASVTAAVNCGMKASGRLSDTSFTSIGASSMREPVTPLSARLIGSMPSTTASRRPFESTALALVVSRCDAYEKVPRTSGMRVWLYDAFRKSIRPCIRGSVETPSMCAARLSRPVTGRSLCSRSDTFCTAKSVTATSKFALPCVGSSPFA